MYRLPFGVNGTRTLLAAVLHFFGDQVSQKPADLKAKSRLGAAKKYPARTGFQTAIRREYARRMLDGGFFMTPNLCILHHCFSPKHRN